MKRIGIDLDNVTTKLDIVLDKMSEVFEKPLAKVEDVDDYNISSVYGITEEEAVQFWVDHEKWICEQSNMSDKVVDSIKKNFIGAGTEIFVITARSLKYKDETIEWLNRHKLKYDVLIMTNGESKKDYLEHFKIDMMIDDKPSLFYEMKDSRVKMVCVDYGYNKGVPCDFRMTLEGDIKDVR